MTQAERTAVTPGIVGRRRSCLARALLGGSLGAWLAASGSVGCGPAVGPPLSRLAGAPGASRPGAPVAFDYRAPSGQAFSAASTRGRVTLVVFITTYDLGSQVLLRQLVEIFHTETPRINVGAVVLEPPRNAPLVVAFAETLELPFPVTLADPATLSADGPFGAVDAVPTTIVLDRLGVERWRVASNVTDDAIRAAIRRAAAAAP